ncbi:hypothetical protein Droror1_Dr00023029 [Drosera rotundifolia]
MTVFRFNDRLSMLRSVVPKISKFIYDLPERLEKCIKTEAYADAVRFYSGATPIFKIAGKAVYTAVRVAAVALFMELLGFSTQKCLTAGGLGTVLLTFADREAVEATRNMELGNKELSQAIQRNNSSRTFILLFLFVLTFSVLFLDWYS